MVRWLFQRDSKGKLKISRRRKDQLFVSNQVATEVNQLPAAVCPLSFAVSSRT